MEALFYLLVGAILVLGIWLDRRVCEVCGRSYSRAATRGERRETGLCLPCYQEAEAKRAGTCLLWVLVLLGLAAALWFFSDLFVGSPPPLQDAPRSQSAAPADPEPQAQWPAASGPTPVDPTSPGDVRDDGGPRDPLAPPVDPGVPVELTKEEALKRRAMNMHPAGLGPPIKQAKDPRDLR